MQRFAGCEGTIQAPAFQAARVAREEGKLQSLIARGPQHTTHAAPRKQACFKASSRHVPSKPLWAKHLGCVWFASLAFSFSAKLCEPRFEYDASRCTTKPSPIPTPPPTHHIACTTQPGLRLTLTVHARLDFRRTAEYLSRLQGWVTDSVGIMTVKKRPSSARTLGSAQTLNSARTDEICGL